MAKKKASARKSSSRGGKSLHLSIDLGALDKLYKRRYDLALDGGDTKGGSINVRLDGDTKGGSISILDGDGDTKGGRALKPGEAQERAAKKSRKRR